MPLFDDNDKPFTGNFLRDKPKEKVDLNDPANKRQWREENPVPPVIFEALKFIVVSFGQMIFITIRGIIRLFKKK